MILTCLSTMTNDFGQLSLYLLDSCIFSSEKISIWVLCSFLKLSCWSLMLSCKRLLYILDIKILVDTWLEKYSSHSVSCLFKLWIKSFDEQKVLILKKFKFLYLLLLVLSVLNLRIHCHIPGHEDPSLQFPCSAYITCLSSCVLPTCFIRVLNILVAVFPNSLW